MRRPKDSRHHRKPRSLNGGDEPRNISMVSEKEHQAWHCIAVNYTPEKIAQIISDVWLDPDWKMIAVRR